MASEDELIQLRKERDALRHYVDLAGWLFVVIGADEQVQLVNRRTCEALGYGEQEIGGSNWFERFVPADVRDTIRGIFRELMAGRVEPVAEAEGPVLTRNGETRCVAWHNSVLRDEHGFIVGTLSAGEDITERLEVFRAMQLKDRAIESSLSAIVRASADGEINYANPAFASMWGFAGPEDVIGGNLNDRIVLEEDRPVIEAACESEALTGELTARRVDGGFLTVQGTLSVARDESGTPMTAMGSFIDVTKDRMARVERERFQEQLQRQSEELLEVSTPVMQVWHGVLAVPLIGVLDSERTQRFMDHLLQRVVDTKSPVILLDITGVPAIDTQTAQHLLDTVSAVRLLGSEVILTGVKPAIAQTIVHLGIDLSGISTGTTLSAGLRLALEHVGLKVVHGDSNTQGEED